MTPRQPDLDHLSRLTGANSRPGDGGHEIRDARTYPAFPEPLFPFPGKEDFVFRLVFHSAELRKLGYLLSAFLGGAALPALQLSGSTGLAALATEVSQLAAQIG